jgi:hypothetical protein
MVFRNNYDFYTELQWFKNFRKNVECMFIPIVVQTVRAHQAARGPALFWPVASPARHGNTRVVPGPTRPSGRAWVDDPARRVSPGTTRINGRPVQTGGPYSPLHLQLAVASSLRSSSVSTLPLSCPVPVPTRRLPTRRIPLSPPPPTEYGLR